MGQADTKQSSPDFVLELEMGLSHQEFFRILPKAYPAGSYTVSDWTVTFDKGAYTECISLAEEWVRKLSAVVSLPATLVTLTMFGGTEADFKAFVWDFQMHYYRGGG